MSFLLRVTLFSVKVIDLQVSFSKSLILVICIRVTCVRDACTRNTYFGGIWIRVVGTKNAYTGSFYTINTCTEGAYINGACTKSACLGSVGTKDSCTESIYIKDTCIKGICIGNSCIACFCTRGFWIGDAYTCVDGAYIEVQSAYGISTCIESSYINNVSIVKYFGIYMEFFQNLEVKGAGLEIQVGAGCVYVMNICFCQNMKVRDIRLEI